MGESNYSCTGPLSLTCAMLAIDGSVDESVTMRLYRWRKRGGQGAVAPLKF